MAETIQNKKYKQQNGSNCSRYNGGTNRSMYAKGAPIYTKPHIKNLIQLQHIHLPNGKKLNTERKKDEFL